MCPFVPHKSLTILLSFPLPKAECVVHDYLFLIYSHLEALSLQPVILQSCLLHLHFSGNCVFQQSHLSRCFRHQVHVWSRVDSSRGNSLVSQVELKRLLTCCGKAEAFSLWLFCLFWVSWVWLNQVHMASAITIHQHSIRDIPWSKYLVTSPLA